MAACEGNKVNRDSVWYSSYSRDILYRRLLQYIVNMDSNDLSLLYR
jgi:hypothetical protein